MLGWFRKYCRSMDEQIRLPGIVERRTHKIAYEHDVGWAEWPATQLHPGLFGRAIVLFVVARCARRHEVLPGIRPPSRFGDDVIHREPFTASTVLAAIAIPAENVFPRDHDPFVRNGGISLQPDDAGPGDVPARRPHVSLGNRIDDLSPLQKE